MKKKILIIFVCTLLIDIASSVGAEQTIGMNQQKESLIEELAPVKKVKEVPIPWQIWENTQPGGTAAIIRLQQNIKQSVAIVRAYALLDEEIPLDGLMWGETMNMSLIAIDNPEEPYILEPGGEVEYFINTSKGDKAVLFRYSVAWVSTPNTQVAHFVTEGVLDQGIVGKGLYNFDVHNDFFLPINNFELEIYSNITLTPDDIIKWYDTPSDPTLQPSHNTIDPISGKSVTIGPLWINGWGAPPQINQKPYGLEIIWKDLKHPVRKCQWIHFGITLNIQKKVKEVPAPWQSWVPGHGGIMDVIRLPEEVWDPDGTAIVRDYVVLNEEIPLDDLTWYDTVNLSWLPIDNPEEPYFLSPGEEVEYFINTSENDKAVLLRYTVAWASTPNILEGHFINEAVLDNQLIIAQHSNPDIHNDYDEPVDNFELELYGVQPSDIISWYYKDKPQNLIWKNNSFGPTLYGGWGTPPVIKAHPDGNGTEIKWKDRKNPIEYCEWVHFGLTLNPNASNGKAKAYWTQLIAPTGARAHFTISLNRDAVTNSKIIVPKIKIVQDEFLVQLSELNPSMFLILRLLLNNLTNYMVR